MTHKYSLLCVFLSFALLLLMLPSVASPADWVASLLGESVIPPVQTQAAGTAWASFLPDDTCGDSLLVSGQFFLDGGSPIALEVHWGTSFESTPIATSVTEFERDGEGIYHCFFRIPFETSPALCDSLEQGLLYLQLTTQANPQGEIRGFFERWSPINRVTWGAVRGAFR